MSRKHALLAPSSASRWLACTPSARREEEYPSYTNDAADEGTFAHSLSELMLKNMLGKIPKIKYNSTLKRYKHNKYYSAELYGHCTDYVHFILEKYHGYTDSMIFIEEEIDLQEFAPESFGHLDIAIIGYEVNKKGKPICVLDINDLKYGKGVLVDANDNNQLRLYALGALRKYMLLYDIDIVRMTIYQPRLDNYPSTEMTSAKLEKWGKNYVIPRAKQAFDGIGKYNPDPGKQCKFCKARYNCKALENYCLELTKYDFKDADKMSDKDVAKVLEVGPDIVTWINGIKEYVLAKAVHDQKNWPGFKLIRGRSNRRYLSDVSIIKALKRAKIKDSLFMTEPQLVGITTLENNLGVDKVAKICGKYITKPEGAPTLVPEWDKRAAIGSSEDAKDAFKDLKVKKIIK